MRSMYSPLVPSPVVPFLDTGKWAVHSLNMLPKPHLQEGGCLNIRQWGVVTTLGLYSMFDTHLPIPAPLLKFTSKLLFCAAFSADLSKPSHLYMKSLLPTEVFQVHRH